MKNGLVVEPNGVQRWYKDDKLHSEDDLPAVIYTDGILVWFQNGVKHRENDLPAETYNSCSHAGSKVWYIDGREHRENGPSTIWNDGSLEWWLHGTRFSFDSWCLELNKSPKEKAFLMLQYMD